MQTLLKTKWFIVEMGKQLLQFSYDVKMRHFRAGYLVAATALTAFIVAGIDAQPLGIRSTTEKKDVLQ